jgi:putative salt-induced outer membrane protein YdiY
MKKHLSAILAALVITSVIGFGIFTIGVSALTNKNTVPIQNTPASATSAMGSNTPADPPGTSTNTLQSQLNQDNTVIQQYQSLIQVLQQQGLIVVDQNGNIYIPRGDFH